MAATLAAGASAEGMSADAWRSTILEGIGPEAGLAFLEGAYRTRGGSALAIAWEA